MSIGRLWRRYRYLWLLLLIIPMLVFAGWYVRGWFLLRQFETERELEGATILADNGEVLTVLGQGPSHYIPLEDIPQVMQDAILAMEDRWFYKHPGFNPIAILRAFYINFKAGRRVAGGSTITQQLAKNLFLTFEKTWTRKLEELALALILEQRYTKDEILELYLNHIYFGEGSYGIEAAARTYFGKSAAELNLVESALLAAIPRSPNAYDPYTNPELARERRNLVLEQMAELEMISEAERQEAAARPLELARRRRGQAPYFLDYVKKQLEERYGANMVYRGGLRVHTTLNPHYQRAAEEAFAKQEFQGALVAIDPQTGFIRAMVGGRDYIESQFNRAVQAHRQPGSAFKPFVYAAALEAGWQQNTLVEDIPREYAGYAPRNYDDRYWGPVVMKHAVAHSLNNAAVWALSEVGISRVIKLAENMGIASLTAEDRNLSLALGGITKGVTPLELAGAFVPFANGGIRYEIRGIQRVLNRDGRVLEDHQPRGVRVLKETTAYLVTDILKSVFDYGTARHLPVNRPAAGKTGTSDETTSLWFTGYTPSIVAVVYIGDDQQRPLPGYGGTLAGPVWTEFINTALADEPPRDFPVPPSVVTGIPIHIFTGLLAGPGCEWSVPCAFIQGTEPAEYAPCVDQSQFSEELPPEPPDTPYDLFWPEAPDGGRLEDGAVVDELPDGADEEAEEDEEEDEENEDVIPEAPGEAEETLQENTLEKRNGSGGLGHNTFPPLPNTCCSHRLPGKSPQPAGLDLAVSGIISSDAADSLTAA
ncbi:MAG: PBP1A family penicillin-binding protein [Firmicutes bacterium]|nr:PBP1A family penicillin-binding protein [Bacillota bacterium]